MKLARRSTLFRSRFRILEEANPSARRRVDPDAGIVYGVKVIGPESSNNRRYTEDCLRRAVHLYENVVVNADHPDDPEDQRSIRDRLGVLKNAKYIPGRGIIADLHLLKSHPMAQTVIEAAQNPNLSRTVGCSHNADGDTEMRNGVLTVTEICHLRSVDIVCDPATTKGLFESVNHPRKKSKGHKMKITLREWFDRTPLLRPVRRTIKKLMEGGFMDPDAQMQFQEAEGDEDVMNSPAPTPTSDPADMSPEDALKSGFRVACLAVLDDTTMPVKDKITRLKKLLTVADDLVGAGQEIPEQEDEGYTGGPDELEDDELMEESHCDEDELMEAEDAEEVVRPSTDNDSLDPAPAPKKGAVKASVKESKQSLVRKVRYLAALTEARELCDERGIEKPKRTLLEALAKLPAEKRATLLEEMNPRRKAKTQHYDPKNPTPAHKGNDDTKSFVAAISRPLHEAQ